MKTLVKYVPRESVMCVKCDRQKDLFPTVACLLDAGCGENTVQENGWTVWVVKSQYDRIQTRVMIDGCELMVKYLKKSGWDQKDFAEALKKKLNET